MLPGEIAHQVSEKTIAWAHSIGDSTDGIGARVGVDLPMGYGGRVGYPSGLNQWYSVDLGERVPIPRVGQGGGTYHGLRRAWL